MLQWHITWRMPDLDRSLTSALIANFKALVSNAGDGQAVLGAILRLKGEELRLSNRIRDRERAGGPLQMNLARADRARRHEVLKILRDLEPAKE